MLSPYCFPQCALCSVTQWCLTLCDPVDCNLPGSSAHGIFQARIVEWDTISSSRGPSSPGITLASLVSPAWQVILYHQCHLTVPTVAAAFCIAPNAQDCSFSTPSPTLVGLKKNFFLNNFQMYMKWYLIMVLICISSMMLSIFSYAYWLFYISSLETCLFKSFAYLHFFIDVVQEFFYVFQISNSLSDI